MALRCCRAGVDTPYVLLSTPLMRKLVLSERTDVPRPCEGSKTLQSQLDISDSYSIGETPPVVFIYISHNALKSVTFWRISLCEILHIIMYGYITLKNR